MSVVVQGRAMSRKAIKPAILLLASLVVAAAPAQAETLAATPTTTPAATAPLSPALAKDYCVAFAKEAEAARDSRQKMELQALNDSLDKKLAEIKDKTAELEKWVTQREAIQAEASAAVLKIYDTMDPTISAQEIAKLDLVAAASILRKMKPKKASDILKEMPAATAARVIAIISSEANLVQSGTP